MTEAPRNFIAEAITNLWGGRCPDYDPGCPACGAWAQYDRLNNNPATPPVVTIPDDATAEEILQFTINNPNATVIMKRQPTAEEVIQGIANVAEAVGFGANEPAAELAGHFVSFLAANPAHIERFLREGHEMVIDGTFTYDQGNLTYRAVDGTIRHPSELRAEKEKAGRPSPRKGGRP